MKRSCAIERRRLNPEPGKKPEDCSWALGRRWKRRFGMFERRPPKMKAEMGTPLGASNSGLTMGQFWAGAVKRLLGCAALSSLSGVQASPFQFVAAAGAGPRPPPPGLAVVGQVHVDPTVGDQAALAELGQGAVDEGPGALAVGADQHHGNALAVQAPGDVAQAQAIDQGAGQLEVALALLAGEHGHRERSHQALGQRALALEHALQFGALQQTLGVGRCAAEPTAQGSHRVEGGHWAAVERAREEVPRVGQGAARGPGEPAAWGRSSAPARGRPKSEGGFLGAR